MKYLKYLLLLLFLVPTICFADQANVYIFHGDGCPHCANAENFFLSIKGDYDFKLIGFEIWYNEANQNLMKDVGEHFNDEVSGVPYIVIGDKTFYGYSTIYNEDIIHAINAEIENNNANDVVKNYINDDVNYSILLDSSTKSDKETTDDNNKSDYADDEVEEVQKHVKKSVSNLLITAIIGGLVIGFISLVIIILIILLIIKLCKKSKKTE